MAFNQLGGKFREEDSSGAPLAGGKLYTYNAGTLTPKATYTTQAMNVSNANPVILDSAGRASVWLGASSYRMILTDANDVTQWDVDNIIEPGAVDADLTASTGSSLIGHIASGTGAIARTAQAKMRDVVGVFDFMTTAQIADVQAGTLGEDVTAAIQAAIDAAYALSLGNITVTYDTIRKGGATVQIPPGAYKTTTTVQLKEGVTLQGAGRFSTVISSSYDGTLIRNQTPVSYDAFGMGIKDLCVQGDRTKTSQIGIALLRDWQGEYSNVSVVECGSHGWRLYQCVGSQFNNVEALECVGRGFYVTDGIVSWASPTDTDLPTNNITVIDIHMYGCDGAGIYLGRIGAGTGVMGCQFFGGSSEGNYASSSDGVGYNVEVVDVASAVPNSFESLWCEDTKVLAHVLINLSDAQETVRFSRFKHFANGAAAWPQKAIIVEKGRLLLDSAIGSGTAYRTYLASNAPFQVTKATGSIYATGVAGSTLAITAAQIVDETGASSGLEANVKVNNYGNIWGPLNVWTDYGETGPTFNQSGQAYPYAKFENYYKGLMFGDGTGAADAGLYRAAANVLAPMTGDTFQVGGVVGETLKFAAGVANASVGSTFSGSIGPTGANAGNQLGWLRINVAGTDRFVPYW